MKLFISAFIFLCCKLSLNGQNQTLGLLLNTDDSYPGYTLLAPSQSTTTFLVDNCGELVHSWPSQFRPGAVSYLLDNGMLLRAGTVSGSFNGGGRGGQIELINWDGTLNWSYRIANTNRHQHHDIEYLPNGNVLALCWEFKSSAQASQAGFDADIPQNSGIWPDMILELKPIGSNNAEIVWEWHIWDHLIQDVDSTKHNYGIISEHPERINANLYLTQGFGFNADWNHCNAIDYNADLDQIVISSRNFSEFWIIDHSTTTEEAASSSGGRYGKGGDILYRWGNPQNYDNGTAQDQKLFGQHDVNWIEHGVNKDKIILYNNATPRQYSSVEIIDTPIDSNGFYTRTMAQPFGPEDPTWIYDRNHQGEDFFSSRVSGAQVLENGNVLICQGEQGLIWEVDTEKETVWRYQNPVRQVPLQQGANPSNNGMFRAYRYGLEFAAFSDKDLTPMGPLELNPIDYTCTLSTATEKPKQLTCEVFPNPASDILYFNTSDQDLLHVEIKSFDGACLSKFIANGSTEISINHIPSGLYFVHFYNFTEHSSLIKKIIIL